MENKIYFRDIVRLLRILDDIHYEKGIKELKSIIFKVNQQYKIKPVDILSRRRAFFNFINGLQNFSSRQLKLELKKEQDISRSEIKNYGMNDQTKNLIESQKNSVRDVDDLIDNTFLHKQGTSSIQTDNIVKSSRKVIDSNFQKDSLNSLGSNSPTRVQHTVLTTQRNQSLSQNLKSLYNNQCQVCGERIQIGVNEYASESHHIQPVGGKDQGPDIAENIIILCPNHHFMFDRGAITIDLVHKKVKHIDSSNALNNTPLILKHNIDECYVTYHNKHLLKEIKVNGQPSGSNRKASNFKTKITLEDSDGEFHEFILPDIHNNHLLKGIEKDLVYARKGEQINFKGFDYAVKEIKKI